METFAHHIQFYDYKPTTFNCVSISEDLLIAAGCSDGSVEVYDSCRNYFLVSRIPGSILKSVECLCWIQNRLFSTGALGNLCEIDVYSSTLKDSVVIGSVTSRCITPKDDHILIGNDEGYVFAFSTVPYLESKLTFPKLTGKLIALSSSNRHDIVAASTSSGTLVTFKYEKNPRMLHTLLSESEIIVWSLLFCGNVLFSGDSSGRVCVWDFKAGGLLTMFSSHLSHVLALTCFPDETAVFSGGADAVIRRYDYCVSEDDQAHWELGSTIRGCRRDIRGLVFVPGQHCDPTIVPDFSDSRFEPHRLVAVGLDARLLVLACEQPEKGLDAFARAHRNLACNVGRQTDPNTREICYVSALPFWPASCCSTRPEPIHFPEVCSDPSGRCSKCQHLCLSHYPDRLVITRLAKRSRKRSLSRLGSQQLCPMSEGALHLATIRPKTGMEIISSCISSCGQFVAYSDLMRTRILRVVISIEKLRTQPCISIRRVCWPANNLKSKSTQKRRNSDLDTSNIDSPKTATSHLVSSSETDTDNDELSQDFVAKFFSLDQQPNEKTDNSKQPVVALAESTLSGDSRPNELPSAQLLSFSPDSETLVMLRRDSNILSCLSVHSGLEHWQLDLNQESFRVHRMHFSNEPTAIGFILCLLCSDGRVRLLSHRTGSHLFTCPSLPSKSGGHPLPISASFLITTLHTFSVSVLYTNSQLSEWLVNISDADSDSQADDVSQCLRVEINLWLSKFWNEMELEVCTTLGVFHSLSYLDKSSWLLASDRYLVLLHRDKQFKKGDINEILQSNPGSDRCIQICKDFESIIQAAVLPSREIAVVTLYSAGIALNLTAPMQRKLFGT